MLNMRRNSCLLLALGEQMLLGGGRGLHQLVRAVMRGTTNVPVITPMRACMHSSVGRLDVSTPGLRVVPPRDCLSFKCLVGGTGNVVASSNGLTRRSAFLNIPYVALGDCSRRPRA